MISELILMAGLLEVPGDAQPQPGPPVQVAQAAGNADEAAAMARAQTGGRVLGVDWSERGGQPVYLVRVLMPDGSIRQISIPANGG